MSAHNYQFVVYDLYNVQVGGRCQSVQLGEYRFDTGPSLLLFPETYRQTFRALGSDISDHVDVRRVEPAAYRVFFGSDDTHLDLLYDVGRMMAQLETVEPGELHAHRMLR